MASRDAATTPDGIGSQTFLGGPHAGDATAATLAWSFSGAHRSGAVAPTNAGRGVAEVGVLEGGDSTVRTVSTVSRWCKCLSKSDLGADGLADGCDGEHPRPSARPR